MTELTGNNVAQDVASPPEQLLLGLRQEVRGSVAGQNESSNHANMFQHLGGTMTPAFLSEHSTEVSYSSAASHSTQNLATTQFSIFSQATANAVKAASQAALAAQAAASAADAAAQAALAAHAAAKAAEAVTKASQSVQSTVSNFESQVHPHLQGAFNQGTPEQFQPNLNEHFDGGARVYGNNKFSYQGPYVQKSTSLEIAQPGNFTPSTFMTPEENGDKLKLEPPCKKRTKYRRAEKTKITNQAYQWQSSTKGHTMLFYEGQHFVLNKGKREGSGKDAKFIEGQRYYFNCAEPGCRASAMSIGDKLQWVQEEHEHHQTDKSARRVFNVLLKDFVKGSSLDPALLIAQLREKYPVEFNEAGYSTDTLVKKINTLWRNATVKNEQDH